jgi:hypothetical protein
VLQRSAARHLSPARKRGGRYATKHRLLVLSDQAVSSLSNVLVTILVASTANRQTFGVFALTLVAYQLALGAIRSVATEPLLSLYADHGPRSRRGIVADIQGTTLLVGAACSLLTCAVAALLDPGPQAAFLALALVLPLVLVQDTWRYLLVIDRPGAALAIDVVWLLVLVPALTLVPSGSEAGTYVLAWGLTGALGAVTGTALGWGLPGWPHPWKWLVRHGAMSWRYFMEFVTAQGVGQLGFAGLAAISGAAALGAARAAWVVFGVLVVVHSGLYMILVPEGVRERSDPGRLRRKFLGASAASIGVSAAWMVTSLLVPSSIGMRLFGDTWDKAEQLLVPMGVVMIAGSALSGALLGIRALSDPGRSLRARLASAPFQAVCPLVGAVLGDATGFVLGLAAGNAVSAVIWWTSFLRATAGDAPADDRSPVPQPAAGSSPGTDAGAPVDAGIAASA